MVEERIRVRITIEYEELKTNRDTLKERLIKIFRFAKLDEMLGTTNDAYASVSRKIEVVEKLL